MDLISLKEKGEAPEWMTQESFDTISRGYLFEDETPKAMYKRVAKAAASYYGGHYENEFFEYLWKNWLGAATPVLSNMGLDRGLPISCYGNYNPDSVNGIYKTLHESAILAKNGGGVGSYVGAIRPRGAAIKGNGQSEGIIPWLKLMEQSFQAVSQGSVRRGNVAAYLDIEHLDAPEFIDIKQPTGDISRRCLSSSFHSGIILSDEFIQSAIDGNKHNQELFSRILTNRVETGEPYLMFRDTVNRNLPQAYVNNGLKVHTSQLCSEIFLHNDENHTFVCCLSSVNLSKYDEWKDDRDFIRLCIYFLDAVMEEFIVKAKQIEGMEKAVRFAEKSRALGLGALGWHTLLQQKLYEFDSFEAMMLNSQIFSKMKKEAEQASKELAILKKEPEWCVGTGMRNTHLIAVAPTMSNSLISGGVSQGVEPIIANIFNQKSAKGTFIRKNPTLEKLLESKGKNNMETWNEINKNKGSLKGLNFLSDHEKNVFLTAKEINQHIIVKQAGQRQKFIDQGQSINLFFNAPSSLNTEDKKSLGKYIHEVHINAWKSGLKSLYYYRGSSIISGNSIYRSEGECKSCEG